VNFETNPGASTYICVSSAFVISCLWTDLPFERSLVLSNISK